MQVCSTGGKYSVASNVIELSLPHWVLGKRIFGGFRGVDFVFVEAPPFLIGVLTRDRAFDKTTFCLSLFGADSLLVAFLVGIDFFTAFFGLTLWPRFFWADSFGKEEDETDGDLVFFEALLFEMDFGTDFLPFALSLRSFEAGLGFVEVAACLSL